MFEVIRISVLLQSRHHKREFIYSFTHIHRGVGRPELGGVWSGKHPRQKAAQSWEPARSRGCLGNVAMCLRCHVFRLESQQS